MISEISSEIYMISQMISEINLEIIYDLKIIFLEVSSQLL